MTITPDAASTAWLMQLRNRGELAAALQVNRGYIAAMQRAGFEMPGGRASVLMAHNFLENSPAFTVDPRAKQSRSLAT